MENIKLVILFGSRAAGKSGVRSDTDLAVLADHLLSLREMSDISRDMARKLKVAEDNIDIIDLQTASPLLQHEVASKGKLLAGREADFIRFRVLAWKRYLDTAKFRRARGKALEKSLHA